MLEHAPAALSGQQSPAPESQPIRITTPQFAAQQPIAPGTVVKGDFLSRLLRHREIGIWMILASIGAAFGLGAMHALSPGHGKTLVAAYLVGSKGTVRHAVFLGVTVTATHTISVFLLGLGVLFFEQYVVPDRIIPWLGAISGLSIVGIGIWLLYQRTKALLPSEREHVGLSHTHNHEHHHHGHESVAHVHSHDGVHVHSHHHDEAHLHSHEHVHPHIRGPHTRSHDGLAPHSHLPEGKITLGSLIGLGISGGLVPCPSALVLMLSAVALSRTGLGLILLVGFSAGLAVVLTGIGMLVVYAKHIIPDRNRLTRHPFFRLIPVFSSVAVILIGLGMTAISLGWVQFGRTFI
jgi:ABC-type nickel/cobalt efflux system permease component RcnA